MILIQQLPFVAISHIKQLLLLLLLLRNLSSEYIFILFYFSAHIAFSIWKALSNRKSTSLEKIFIYAINEWRVQCHTQYDTKIQKIMTYVNSSKIKTWTVLHKRIVRKGSIKMSANSILTLVFLSSRWIHISGQIRTVHVVKLDSLYIYCSVKTPKIRYGRDQEFTISHSVYKSIRILLNRKDV